MTTYKCLDCGSDMTYEQGLYWNNTLSECFYKFNCSKCGSKFEHRLTKEEEEELIERGNIKPKSYTGWLKLLWRKIIGK